MLGSKYDKATGIMLLQLLTNVKDWAHFDVALASRRSKEIQVMYYQGNFKVVNKYILINPHESVLTPVFKFLGI